MQLVIMVNIIYMDSIYLSPLQSKEAACHKSDPELPEVLEDT